MTRATEKPHEPPPPPPAESGEDRLWGLLLQICVVLALLMITYTLLGFLLSHLVR